MWNSTEQDVTVLIPSAGRRQKRQQSNVDELIRDAALDAGKLPSSLQQNRLIASAHTLLLTGARIRVMPALSDLNALQQSLLAQIAEFEASATHAGASVEQIQFARYLICTFLDESVASTPWGATSGWVQHSLLVRLHGDGWGGEKCFRYLDKLAVDPGRNIDLIELFYVCITLGFAGQYRIRESGALALEQLRRRLYELIRTQRGECEQDLAANWRGAALPSLPKNTLLPLWAATGIGLAVMAITFVSFLFALNDKSDDLAWNTLRLAPPQIPVTASIVQETPVKRIAAFLEREIAEGLVEVRETNRESVVIFRGDGLFTLGSAEPKPSYAVIIQRVAQAINDVPGMVVVSGHTDNQKMRSARFPSNWHLSKARADAVLNMIGEIVRDRSRLSAVGLGDSQPVSSNDTSINRAKNRRVEITLRVAGA